jgi:hypothetical protein
VLRDLVEGLEADAGAGQLTNEQTALHNIARSLTDAFQANSRSNETSWRRLEASFNAAQHAEPRIAFDDGRTLN